jgi:biotin carboxyl carrier protein
VLRRFSVKLGGKERIVELGVGDDGRQRFVVDGVERALELSAVGDGAWLVRDGVAQTLAYVDGGMDAAKIGVSIRRPGADPVVVAVEVTEARSAAVAALVSQTQRATGAGPATVKAPMPGRLVKVLVRAGQRVAAGQPVVVVEAMKMENELRSPKDGRVVEVWVVEGQAVEGGARLAAIE